MTDGAKYIALINTVAFLTFVIVAYGFEARFVTAIIAVVLSQLVAGFLVYKVNP